MRKGDTMSSMKVLPWCLFSQAGWTLLGSRNTSGTGQRPSQGSAATSQGCHKLVTCCPPGMRGLLPPLGLAAQEKCDCHPRIVSQEIFPALVLWFCGSVTGTCVLQVELCVTYTHTNAHGQASLVVSVFHTLLCVYIYPHVPCIFIHMSLTDTHMEHGGE